MWILHCMKSVLDQVMDDLSMLVIKSWWQKLFLRKVQDFRSRYLANNSIYVDEFVKMEGLNEIQSIILFSKSEGIFRFWNLSNQFRFFQEEVEYTAAKMIIKNHDLFSQLGIRTKYCNSVQS